jgi:hypothetical protein
VEEIGEKEKALAGLISSAILIVGQVIYAVFQMIFSILASLARL